MEAFFFIELSRGNAQNAPPGTAQIRNSATPFDTWLKLPFYFNGKRDGELDPIHVVYDTTTNS